LLKGVQLLTASDVDAIYHLKLDRVVVINGDIGPLSIEQEEALRVFVENGGGLVCVGDAAEAYHEDPLLGEILGNIHGICTPRTEIIARVATPDHYLTRRFDPSFAVFEAVYLLDIVPSDAEILWRTSWQYMSHTLAYTRSYGQGRVFCTTLGSSPEIQELPIFQQMLNRASGVDTEEHVKRVAMIGYGAIGFEHGTAINEVPGLEYALVCDRNEERLAIARKAFPGVRTCTDLAQVAEDPDIDVVIVSTPPNTHAAISVQMLQAGKHVVSEKPLRLLALARTGLRRRLL
jgi:type 1 glutamine amidotransferase